MRGESAASERETLRALLSPESFVEVAAVIGAFNTVDRIADATGIPLDPVLQAMSKDLRDQLDLGRDVGKTVLFEARDAGSPVAMAPVAVPTLTNGGVVRIDPPGVSTAYS